jgi:hypothetical protein
MQIEERCQMVNPYTINWLGFREYRYVEKQHEDSLWDHVATYLGVSYPEPSALLVSIPT